MSASVFFLLLRSGYRAHSLLDSPSLTSYPDRTYVSCEVLARMAQYAAHTPLHSSMLFLRSIPFVKSRLFVNAQK